MALEDPVVITCAISGALASRDQCPAIPYTPAEYAAEARRIVEEGGVQIHIHARSADGAPSYAPGDFVAIADAIKTEIGDAALINFSTGAVGASVEQRVAYLAAARPDVAALNMGSLNYAKYSRSRKGFAFVFVFANPFSEITELLGAMRELGIRPEAECFDLGHVASMVPLLDMGLLEPPVSANLVMGVLGGVPASASNLLAMTDNLPADRARPAHWSVIGIGRGQWSMVAAALGMGGSIRVGLEDNFYLPSGEMARSNGELVAQGRALAQASGRGVATVGQARSLLGLSSPD
jgi:uncharacterized protein (DUF849 family)